MNVPWTDTWNPNAVTGISRSGTTFTATKYNGGTFTFTQQDNNTDTNTWRPVQNNLTSTSTTDCLSAYQGKLLNDKITACAPKFKSLWSGTVKTATTTTFTSSGYGFFLVVYLTGSMYGTKYIPGGTGDYCLETLELSDTYGLTVYQRMISIRDTSFVTKDAYYTRSGTNHTKYNDAIQIKAIYGVA